MTCISDLKELDSLIFGITVSMTMEEESIFARPLLAYMFLASVLRWRTSFLKNY